MYGLRYIQSTYTRIAEYKCNKRVTWSTVTSVVVAHDSIPRLSSWHGNDISPNININNNDNNNICANINWKCAGGTCKKMTDRFLSFGFAYFVALPTFRSTLLRFHANKSHYLNWEYNKQENAVGIRQLFPTQFGVSKVGSIILEHNQQRIIALSLSLSLKFMGSTL